MQTDPFLNYALAPVSPILGEFRVSANQNRVFIPGVGSVFNHGCCVTSVVPTLNLKAAGAADLLAWQWRQDKPKAPLRELYEKAVTWMAHTTGRPTPNDTELAALARRLHLNRFLFDMMANVASMDRRDTQERRLLTIALEAAFGAGSSHRAGCHVFSANAANRLVNGLTNGGFPTVWDTSRPAIVVPWFVAPHIVGGIDFYASPKSIPTRVTLIPGTAMFTRLHLLTSENLDIVDSPLLSIPEESGWLTCAARLSGGSDETLFPMRPRVRVLYDDQSYHIQLSLLNRLFAMGVPASLLSTQHRMQSPNTSGEDILEHVLGVAERLTAGDIGLSDSLRNVLEATGPSVAVRNAVISRLMSLHRYRCVQEIQRRYHEGALVSGEKFEVLISEDGYVFRDKISGDRSVLTNHLLELKSQVVFPGSAERFLVMKALVRGETAELVVPEGALETGRKYATFLIANAPSTQEPARVIDSDKSKYVLNHLKSKALQLPLRHGISFLGWDRLSARFFSPMFQATAAGVDTAEVPWHPGVSSLKFFSRTSVEAKWHEEVHPAVAQVVGIALAMVHRSFLSYSAEVIDLQNIMANRRIVVGVLEGVGQVNAVELNRTGRAACPKEIVGHPFYTYGIPSGQQGFHAFNLSDKGLLLEEAPDEEIKKGAEMLLHLLFKMVPVLLSGESLLDNPVNRIQHSAALAQEGSLLVRRLTGALNWPEMAEMYPWLESALRAIGPSRMKQHVAFHLGTQRYHLILQGLPKEVLEHRHHIQAELTQLCKQVTLEGCHLIIDSASASALLSNYFNGALDVTYIGTEVVDQARSTG